MKGLLTVGLALLLLLGWAVPAGAEGPELACISAMLLDGESGAVLYEANSQQRCYPASVTKIMTMVLILEAVEKGVITLADQVTVSQAAAEMGGSQVYLYAGEVRSVEEMLIAIAVGSGNDAAYAMAEFVGGSYAGFIQMMNDKAAELGMNDTHFANPHGLHDPEHYTTAADLAALALYALSFDSLLDYTSIYEYEFRPEPRQLILWNTNRLLKWYEGTDGLKTGYTPEAGRNLVATAQRDGLRLISVVLGCQERKGHFQESMTLLNYGFNSYKHETVCAAGAVVGQIPVSKGSVDTVEVCTASELGYTTAKSASPEVRQELLLEPLLAAPAPAGTLCGRLELYDENNTLLDSAQLITATAVEKGGWLRTWGKLMAAIW